MKISVYIIAYNEVEKIRDCLNSVLWADEIILVDSYSTDGTQEIAKELGAKIVQVNFEGYGHLRNQAINNCSNEWILSIDSDERCTPEVRDEILEIIEDSELDIYKIPRKNYFMGKWINYSGWFPNYRQPQLFRKGSMTYDNKPVHEGYINHTNKKIGVLENYIWQFPFKNFEELMHKANRYSSLGVEKLEMKKAHSSVLIAFLHGLWSFLKHYFLKLGFLDGGAGFVIAFGNFEGTFYRYIKLAEKRADWSPPHVQQIKKPEK